MLIYGTRSAVDTALHRMVQSGFITRLARGVFVRDSGKEPSILDIARAKAAAFKKGFVAQPENILVKLGISSRKYAATFVKTGRSSSFWTIRGRVYLRGISERKNASARNRDWQDRLRAVVLGKEALRICTRSTSYSELTRQEKAQLWRFGSIMPKWLNDLCRHRYPPPRVEI